MACEGYSHCPNKDSCHPCTWQWQVPQSQDYDLSLFITLNAKVIETLHPLFFSMLSKLENFISPMRRFLTV